MAFHMHVPVATVSQKEGSAWCVSICYFDTVPPKASTPDQIIALVIFVVVMVTIVTEKVHRTLAALAGAMMLFLTGMSPFDAAWSTSTSIPSACWWA